MKSRRTSLLIKSLIYGLGCLGLLLLVGFIITKVTSYKNLENILFIEGIIAIFIGIFTSISGDPMGSSLQGLGDINAQQISTANLETTRKEKEKVNNRINISFAVSTFSLFIGGILSVILSFII